MSVRYFQVDATLFAAAKSATEPAVDDDRCMYEGAKVQHVVSQHVVPQTTDLPLAQGVIVSPSGRFSSDRLSPCGSRIAGIFAAERALLIMGLSPE